MASGLFNAAMPIFEGFAGQFAMGAAFYVTARAAGRIMPIFLRTIRGLPVPHSLYQRRISPWVGTSGQMEDLMEDDDEHVVPDIDSADAEAGFDPSTLGSNDQDAPPLGSGFEYHINPLQVLFRAVPFPVVGVIDIAVRRSTAVAYHFVSLFYHAFPLSSTSRLSRFLRIYRRTPGYEPYPNLMVADERCDYCGRPLRIYKVGGPSPHDRLGCGCAQYLLYTFKFLISVELEINPLRDIGLRRSFDDIRPFPQFESRALMLTRLLGVDFQSGCDHPQVFLNKASSQYEVPGPTPDGLYWQPPRDRWRSEERAGGVRCVHHYANTLHNWHPALLTLIKSTRRFHLPNDRLNLLADDVLTILYSLAKWCEVNLTPGHHYFLQSITLNRVECYQHVITQESRIFLIDRPEVRDKLVHRFSQLGSPQTHWLVLPWVGSPVCFASWRLALMLVNPVPCWLHSINQSFTGYQDVAVAVVKDAKLNLSSLEIGNCWPFFMGNALVFGGSINFDPIHFAKMFLLVGDCYGFDEVYVMLKFQPVVVIYNALGLPPLMAPVVSPLLKPQSVVTFSIVSAGHRTRVNLTADFTRERIAQMASIASSPYSYQNLGFWHGFFDPRAVDITDSRAEFVEIEPNTPQARSLTIRPNNLPGDNIIAEASHMTGGVVFYTFGSRGDRNPVLGIARHLNDMGAKVIVYHLATEAEGKILAGNKPAHESVRVALFIRAREEIRRINAPLAFSPAQLLVIGSSSYDLLPPPDIIYPFRASDNPLIAVAYTVFGFFTSPDFHIGPYARPFYLPTSIDGKKFLEYRPNTGAVGSVAAYWGGDGTVPPGYEHIRVFPPGDHSEMFCTVQTVYTGGTVGATGLGGASGTRIVSADERLDHAYRNPDDCSAGTGIGTDPSAILLALGSLQPVYLGIWARRNFYRIDKIFAWYGIGGLCFNGFKLLMLYLLFSRYQKPSMVSGDPLTTLLMLTFNITRLGLLDYVAIFAGAKMVDKALVSMGRDYYWLTAIFITYTSALLDSIPALWAAQRYSLGAGYLAVFIVKLATPLADATMGWFTSTLLPARFGAPSLATANWVYELTVRWHYIPVFHCALVNPVTGVRFEGVRNEFGHYAFEFKPGGFQGFMNFPTSLTTQDLDARLRIHERYGLTWNCQVGLYRMFPGMVHLFGFGAIPILLHTFGAIIISTLVVSVVTVSYGFSLFLPSLIGVRFTRHGQVRILGDMVSNLIDAISTDYPPRAILNWFSGLGII